MSLNYGYIKTDDTVNLDKTVMSWVYSDPEKTELKKELEECKDLNKKLTEKLLWLTDNPEKLEELPALKQAYDDYLMLRRIILGE